MLHPHRPAPAVAERLGPERTAGLVMDLGWRYDLMVRAADLLLFRGGLRRALRHTVELARLEPGEHVLDVGCGTGDLALLARRAVGAEGSVVAIDPGPRQIARARWKAERAGLAVDFGVGIVERLDLPPAGFDAVLSTFMMHHLPDATKAAGLAEIARVLRPGGRVVIVDFNRPTGRGAPRRFGAGEAGAQDLPRLLWDAGYEAIDSGPVPLPRFAVRQGAAYAKARLPAWT